VCLLRKIPKGILQNHLKKIGIRGWRRMAEDREGWRQAIAEVQALQGL
jgi:hypothetical protein